MNPYEYVDAHRAAFVDDLKDLLRIPSISTLPEHAGDVRKAANWLIAQFNAIGISDARLYEKEGHHPIVYAEWMGAGDAPTVLIYGHYDVQPADDPFNEWRTDPFEPVERDGNLYARGATDDKGQTWAQIKAIHSLLATGNLKVNVKFLIEGEEESGGPFVSAFVRDNTELLKADVAVVSDTSILAIDRPLMVYGLRGIAYMEIIVNGPKGDLHSGMYGGIVHNPAQALAEIIARLHDEDGRVAVPGFYDKVLPVGDEERAELAKIPFPVERFKAETGLDHDWGEAGYERHERLGARPTLEINGIVGGWTGEGGKTVIPARALAKVSCRLVPNQNPHEIVELIQKYLQEITPPTVTSMVRPMHHGNPVVINLDSPYMQAAVEAYEFGFGARPVFTREGGSIPIVGAFQALLGTPVIMMGMGLPDDNLHAPNEKFSLECFYRGMRTAVKFYEEVGRLPR